MEQEKSSHIGTRRRRYYTYIPCTAAAVATARSPRQWPRRGAQLDRYGKSEQTLYLPNCIVALVPIRSKCCSCKKADPKKPIQNNAACCAKKWKVGGTSQARASCWSLVRLASHFCRTRDGPLTFLHGIVIFTTPVATPVRACQGLSGTCEQIALM